MRFSLSLLLILFWQTFFTASVAQAEQDLKVEESELLFYVPFVPQVQKKSSEDLEVNNPGLSNLHALYQSVVKHWHLHFGNLVFLASTRPKGHKTVLETPFFILETPL